MAKKGSYAPGMAYANKSPSNLPVPRAIMISEQGLRPSCRRTGALWTHEENRARMLGQFPSDWPGYPVRARHDGV